MRTRLVPVLLKLNEIINEQGASLDPPNEHEAEAMRLICFAKDVLTRARSEMQKADMERADG